MIKKIMVSGILMTATWMMADKPSENEEHLALIQEYQMMFSKIGEKRTGAAPEEIESVHPPFVRLKKEEVKKVLVKKDGKKVVIRSGYNLQAIINHLAKINGHWYKVGDQIDDFRVAEIEESGVFLQNNAYKKRLTLRTNNEKISIK